MRERERERERERNIPLRLVTESPIIVLCQT
jgi:hypothetical protein